MLDTILNLYKNFFAHGEMISAAAFTMKDFIQVLFVVLIICYLYVRFIRNTLAEKLVRGILLFVIGASIVSVCLLVFDLKILYQIVQYLLMGILLSLVIVFQPELRKLLVHLGQTNFFAKNFFSFKKDDQEKKTNVVKEITEAVKYCSRVKRGALIVIQKDQDRSFYNEVGTTINADITAELILTIFFPNTPLHDGAMVIYGDKILAAGVLLPLTEDPKLSWRYGTRHRAAIGASETQNAACIVVSEETGDISIAIDGILKKYEDITKFKEDLSSLLSIDNEEKMNNVFIQNLLKLRKK